MLCDSNILIYAAEPGETRCDPFVQNPSACMASVTRIEVLGFPGFYKLDNERQSRLVDIIESLIELPLNEGIIRRAIELRQQRRISLADSIIASTALEHGLSLITRNVDDYKHIANLQIINPFD